MNIGGKIADFDAHVKLRFINIDGQIGIGFQNFRAAQCRKLGRSQRKALVRTLAGHLKGFGRAFDAFHIIADKCKDGIGIFGQFFGNADRHDAENFGAGFGCRLDIQPSRIVERRNIHGGLSGRQAVIAAFLQAFGRVAFEYFFEIAAVKAF